MKTWMKWAIAAVVVVILGVVGGPFVYINFIKDDPPDRFALDDGDASAATDAPTTAAAHRRRPTPATERPRRRPRRAAATPATTAAPAAAGAVWTIDPATSAVGYRVVEVLFGQDTEGVGRTSAITGQLTLDGTQVTAAELRGRHDDGHERRGPARQPVPRPPDGHRRPSRRRRSR